MEYINLECDYHDEEVGETSGSRRLTMQNMSDVDGEPKSTTSEPENVDACSLPSENERNQEGDVSSRGETSGGGYGGRT